MQVVKIFTKIIRGLSALFKFVLERSPGQGQRKFESAHPNGRG